MPYRKVYHHVRKHRKKYSRFILFFVILLTFRVIEDYFLIKSIGIEFEIDIFILFSIILIASIFTGIAELTEELIEEKEAKKILETIKRDKEKLIKKINKK